MENFENTILAQYANSPILLQYLNSINAAIDPSANINNFYNDVWNIDTAIGYGLDVWGRIVGISRILQIPGDELYFGFEEASATGFNQNPFFNAVPVTQNYILSDEAYRTLILAKAFSNISGSSSADYNILLSKLFKGRGNAYITNIDTMISRLVFQFELQPFEISILKYSGAISPPTGVTFQLMQYTPYTTFGFAEAGETSAPFDNGTFFNGFL